MIRVLDIVPETTVDGPGFRTSIYCAGCSHQCPGCHNPQSWDFSVGQEMSVEELAQVVLADEFADVTFSGGDPMYQAGEFARLAQFIKERSSKTIWCYTGFRFEELTAPEQQELLRHIDVLVDGPFVAAQRDTSLRFRGSSNQRLIDVQASLRRGTVVQLDESTEVQQRRTRLRR